MLVRLAHLKMVEESVLAFFSVGSDLHHLELTPHHLDGHMHESVLAQLLTGVSQEQKAKGTMQYMQCS